MQLKTYGDVGEPIGVDRLYRNFPGLNGRVATPAAVGQDLWDRVSEANKRVNGAIRYSLKSPSDWAGPKPQEHISGLTGKPVTTLVGNCRDYVITKMLELQAMGVPRGAMRMADVYIEGPGTPADERHHLVLLLQQEDGRAWILDNRTPEIYDWPGLPTYRWRGVEQPGRSEWGRLTPPKPVGLDEVLRQTGSGVPGDGG